MAYFHHQPAKPFYFTSSVKLPPLQQKSNNPQFFLSNPVEFPCQPSLPTLVSISVILTKLARLPTTKQKIFLLAFYLSFFIHVYSDKVSSADTLLTYLTKSQKQRITVFFSSKFSSISLNYSVKYMSIFLIKICTPLLSFSERTVTPPEIYL